MKYRLYNKRTHQITHATEEEAEATTLLDIEAIEWAIEATGRCDTEDYIITEVGTKTPKLTIPTGI